MEAEQPSLRERRRLQTRQELAQAAAELFTAQGVAATTAEQIAGRAGISLRTFYRHFRTKEEAIAPVLEIGAERWQAALRTVPVGEGWQTAVAGAVRAMLSPVGGTTEEGLELVRDLLVAAGEDRELADVWAVVNARSERELLAVMRERLPEAGHLTLALHSAAATAAIRVGLEAWAEGEAADDGGHPASSLAAQAYLRLSAGL
ncbi:MULTISPECIES: TetR/AcrR family transcriptional regulator [Arthrobacter]|uniref:Helix-turn-helix domain-containing protein n=2 Tax=Arthrobacter TaxID=1663 RepID=A0ABU9KN37_9MICC|nr:TetR/AcrR family transcriptional regulator [Arthrobacter sp. YJM1]MDP5228269.1 helix-turn-helix domain-containing protein [Arthrobacter sp. YJM1]